jgi:hypothetical protein
MLDNSQRREILDAAKAVDYQGSIMDLFAQGASGMNVPAMLHAQQEQQQQQQQMMTANTPQEQEVGLREQHAMGNTQASMAFPDVPPNASFNTEGMQVPMNISKFDQQGHLVQSFENVPPGVQDLPTGPARGTVVETPAYQRGGFDRVKNLIKRGQTEDIELQIDPYDLSSATDTTFVGTSQMRENAKKIARANAEAYRSIQEGENVEELISSQPGKLTQLPDGTFQYYYTIEKNEADKTKSKRSGGYKKKYQTAGEKITRAEQLELNRIAQEERAAKNRAERDAKKAVITEAQTKKVEENLAEREANQKASRDWWGNIYTNVKDNPLSSAQIALTGAEMSDIPVVSQVAGVLNTGISGTRGLYNTAIGDSDAAKMHYTDAGLGVAGLGASFIPGLGTTLDATKMGRLVTRMGTSAPKVIRGSAHLAENVGHYRHYSHIPDYAKDPGTGGHKSGGLRKQSYKAGGYRKKYPCK